MTIFALHFTAELVKIIDFRPTDEFETHGKFLFQRLICERCEGNDNTIYLVNLSQLYQVLYKGAAIEVHGYTNCKHCGNMGFIQMRRDVGNNYTPLTAELSRAGKYATIMHFNIEGMKPNPNECSFLGIFVASTEDNRKINNIALASRIGYKEEGGTGAAILYPKVGLTIAEVDTTASSSATAGSNSMDGATF